MQRIAVVIVNFNSGELLGQCLDSLAAQRVAPDRVIVVDNASHDGSEQATRRHTGVELLREGSNRGFAAATNTGVAAAADCDWIATLNPDARAAPDWIERVLSGIAAHPTVAMFACRLLDAADPARLDGAGDVYHLSGLAWRHLHGCPDHRLPGVPVEVFGPCAAGALYRREALLGCGGFDEALFCYLEDVDLAFRLRLAGERCLLLPDAVVMHHGSATVGVASDFQLYHGHRNLVRVFVKNMPGLLFAMLLPAHLLLNLLAIAWYAVRGRGAVILRAKRDACRGLPQAWQARRAVQQGRRVSAAAIWRVLHKGLWRLGYRASPALSRRARA